MSETENISTDTKSDALFFDNSTLRNNRNLNFPNNDIQGVSPNTSREEFEEKYKEINTEIFQNKLIALYCSGKIDDVEKMYPGFSQKYGEQLDKCIIKTPKAASYRLRPDAAYDISAEIPSSLYQEIKADFNNNFEQIYKLNAFQDRAKNIVGNGFFLDEYCAGNIDGAEAIFPGFSQKYGKELEQYKTTLDDMTVCDAPQELRNRIVSDYANYLANKTTLSQDIDGIYENLKNHALANQYLEQTIKPQFSEIQSLTPNYEKPVIKDVLPFPEQKFIAGFIATTDLEYSASQNIVGLDKEMKPELSQLSLEDYQAVALSNKINTIKNKLIALYASGKAEEADKILPGFSEKYKDELSKTNINVNFSGTTSNDIKKDILENFDKIYPDFKKDCEAKRNADREANNITETITLTDAQLTWLMNRQFPSFKTQEIASQNRKAIQEYLDTLTPTNEQTNQKDFAQRDVDIQSIKNQKEFAHLSSQLDLRPDNPLVNDSMIALENGITKRVEPTQEQNHISNRTGRDRD